MNRKLFKLVSDLFDEASAASGEAGTAGEGNTQAAAENGAQGTDPNGTVDATPEATKTFDELIKGQYKEDFDKRVQDIIGKRFKQSKKTEERLTQMNPIMNTLAAKYGLDPSDVEGIAKAVADDDVLYAERAMQNGLSVEQQKKQDKIEAENRAYRQERERQAQREQAERQYNQWKQEAEQVKAQFPNFDLDAELQNQDFVNDLLNGVPIRKAYVSNHFDEIISGAMGYTAQEVAKKTTDTIASRAGRPVENGLSSQAAFQSKIDVSKTTRQEREEIARRAMRGERISFN